ncbi:MAG: PEP-CTERM sorting domain-containing protein [Abditibacteriota bacterium]|nr:PEP-CTERM sorting domain-containing protein [Abditibacteriota bacterium]
MEFTFPESGTAEVPEPSSLLALAFGGAGTALAIRKRKQR